MAKLKNLSLSVCTEGATASIASLAAALEASSGLLDRLVDAGFGPLVFGDDVSGLFRCEAIDLSASRTGELHGLRVMPDERYIEFVAAIADNGGPDVARFSHGWPILSSVSGSTTIPEAGGAASLARGGAA